MNGHRHSIRLNGYDYSSPGLYFVTICAIDRKCIFGNVENGNMIPNELGIIIQSTWESLPNHHPVELDIFQIMPNHLHFIIYLQGGSRPAPTLGLIIGFLKSESTKQFHNSVGATRGSPDGSTRGSPDNHPTIWQRNYFEHIIRNEKEYLAISQYIQENPTNWQGDKLWVE
jgi:putative transposase